MNAQVAVLYAATFSVAAFHTMSPDHWLPFVMLGKSQRWSRFKTMVVSLIAGIGHVGTSVVIALFGIFLGAELSQQFASIAEVTTGAALIIFGFAYALYAWRAGGHVHLIGGHKHGDGAHSHDHGDHDHNHDHSHGHDHGHDHDHAPAVIADKRMSKAAYGPVIIVGLTPCVTLLPMAFAAAGFGIATTLGVIGLFAVSTIAPIMVLTYLGSTGIARLNLKWVEKRGDVVTGLIIGCIGLMTMILGL